MVNSKAYHFFMSVETRLRQFLRVSEAPNIGDGNKLWWSRFLVMRMCCFFFDNSNSRVGRGRENPISNGDRNVDYNSWIFFFQIISGNV